MTAKQVAERLGVREFVAVCAYFDARKQKFEILSIERHSDHVLCTCRVIEDETIVPLRWEVKTNVIEFKAA